MILFLDFIRENLNLKHLPDNNSKVFGDSAEQVSSHPKLIAHFDALAGADLKFPLSRHDLRVCSGDLDSSVETRSVMRLDYVATVNVICSHSAVVRTLTSYSHSEFNLSSYPVVPGILLWAIGTDDRQDRALSILVPCRTRAYLPPLFSLFLSRSVCGSCQLAYGRN